MTTQSQTPPRPGDAIPLPPDFPVHWPRPSDARLFWEFDTMHFPGQNKPLVENLIVNIYDYDFNRVAELYELPVRFLAMVVNSYLYIAFVPAKLVAEPGKQPAQSAPSASADAQQQPETLAEIEKRYMRNFARAIAQIEETWTAEWLPEIQRYIATCEAFDLSGAPLSALMEHLAFALKGYERLWEIHFLLILPASMALHQFNELYHELFPGADKFAALTLLQGQMNKSIEVGNALWRLSRRAVAAPTVKQVFATHTDGEVLENLRLSLEGRQFIDEFKAFLAEYGKRSDAFVALSDPSWIEDPTPALKNLRDYLSEAERDPEVEQRMLAEEAQKAIETARTQLKGYPQAVRDQFEQMLKAAQLANILQEDHNYWIDQRGAWQLRAILLEFGRRFAAAGVIEDPLDVMFLTLDELQTTAQQFPHANHQAHVVQRKAEFEHFGKTQPPRIIGTLPTAPPPDDPFSKSVIKFFGFDAPAPSLTGNVLYGLSGSPGTVRGIAKVVPSLAEAKKLHKGDILVTRTTAPPWTPLFATAAAVVTEAGGILSHCAIVAREYRIPAVLGVRNATQRLEDGMLIEVDGDAGTVRILE